MSDSSPIGTRLRDTERLDSTDYAVDDDTSGRQSSAPATQRYTRRLSDKILIAFHHACDQTDLEIADQLLHVLENMLTRRPMIPDGNRRRSMETLVAAHERLWHLRHQSDMPN